MPVTAEEIAGLSSQCAELIRRVAQGSVPLNVACGAVQTGIECEFEPVGRNYMLERYASAEQQVANLCTWNALAGGYFDDRQITNLLESIPDFEWSWYQPLRALVLCWTMNTLEHTLGANLAIMRSTYGDKLIVGDSLLHLSHGDVYLPEGAPEFIPNRIWWDVIDFGANYNISPDRVDPASAAGIQLFSAACHHPAAVLAQNGGLEPFWDVPGLRIRVPKKSSRRVLPYIHGMAETNHVTLDTCWVKHPMTGRSQPEVVRVP